MGWIDGIWKAVFSVVARRCVCAFGVGRGRTTMGFWRLAVNTEIKHRRRWKGETATEVGWGEGKYLMGWAKKGGGEQEGIIRLCVASSVQPGVGGHLNGVKNDL